MDLVYRKITVNIGGKISNQPFYLFSPATVEKYVDEQPGISGKNTLVGLFVMLKLVGVGNTKLDLAERHPRRAEVMVSEISKHLPGHFAQLC